MDTNYVSRFGDAQCALMALRKLQNEILLKYLVSNIKSNEFKNSCNMSGERAVVSGIIIFIN
jgi:hypothetical protein